MQKWIFALIYLLIFTHIITANEVNHTVKKGETLYSIARYYEISLDDVLTLNNIEDPSRIQAGFVLKIPGKNSLHHKEYIVEKGDTLYSIARKHNIDVDSLLQRNELEKNSIIRPGQNIRIPVLIDNTREIAPTKVVQTSSSAAVKNSSYYWPVNGEMEKLSGKLQGSKISANLGDIVYSVSSGQVVWEGPYRGFGRVVFIESGSGYVYVYGGNEKINVSVGDDVQPGSAIGEIGLNVYEGKAAMFFAVYKDGKPVDVEKAPRL